jgi:hypothetical protein
MAEPATPRVVFDIDVIHSYPLLRDTRPKSYIGAPAVIMEFSGRCSQCFGRVKAAIEIKIVAISVMPSRATACRDRCSSHRRPARSASKPCAFDFLSATR